MFREQVREVVPLTKVVSPRIDEKAVVRWDSRIILLGGCHSTVSTVRTIFRHIQPFSVFTGTALNQLIFYPKNSIFKKNLNKFIHIQKGFVWRWFLSSPMRVSLITPQE